MSATAAKETTLLRSCEQQRSEENNYDIYNFDESSESVTGPTNNWYEMSGFADGYNAYHPQPPLPLPLLPQRRTTSRTSSTNSRYSNNANSNSNSGKSGAATKRGSQSQHIINTPEEIKDKKWKGQLGEGIFLVDKIIDKRIEPDGSPRYLIKWKGYSSANNTWEPKENISGPLVKRFEDRLRKTQETLDSVKNENTSHTLPKLRLKGTNDLPLKTPPITTWEGNNGELTVETITRPPLTPVMTDPLANSQVEVVDVESEHPEKQPEVSIQDQNETIEIVEASDLEKIPQTSLAHASDTCEFKKPEVRLEGEPTEAQNANTCTDLVPSIVSTYSTSDTPGQVMPAVVETASASDNLLAIEGTASMPGNMLAIEGAPSDNNSGAIIPVIDGTLSTSDNSLAMMPDNPEGTVGGTDEVGASPLVKYDTDGFRIMVPEANVSGRELREIIATTSYAGENIFLVAFQDAEDFALVKADVMNVAFPQEVIHYYENRIIWFGPEESEETFPERPDSPIITKEEVVKPKKRRRRK